MVWAGTYTRFECGPLVTLTLDEDGVHWLVAIVERQNEVDEFEADGWSAEGMIGR